MLLFFSIITPCIDRCNFDITFCRLLYITEIRLTKLHRSIQLVFTTNSKLQELFFSFLCLQNGTTLKLHTLMYQAIQININAIFHIKAKIVIFNAWPNSCWTLLIRLRLKFSHLNEHNFGHKFKDCVRPCVTVVLKFKQLNTFFLPC